MVVGREHTLDREIQRVGRVGGEDDPPGVLETEQPGQLLSSLLDGASSLDAHPMDMAAGAGSRPAQEVAECPVDDLRLGPARSSVIEVDHLLHPDIASVD